jgi:hypothetical protein
MKMNRYDIMGILLLPISIFFMLYPGLYPERFADKTAMVALSTVGAIVFIIGILSIISTIKKRVK